MLQNGNTPMHMAAAKDHIETLKLLYKFGGDIRSCNKVTEYGNDASKQKPLNSVLTLYVNVYVEWTHSIGYSHNRETR
jgi:ankyrin repeat protein